MVYIKIKFDLNKFKLARTFSSFLFFVLMLNIAKKYIIKGSDGINIKNSISQREKIKVDELTRWPNQPKTKYFA